ncbi:RNA-binding protein Musashi homolog Rbp6-like [Littorina saxatilis]|uniref:RNA-binding protein Musashi homolog Rbp6-like n=1 Tax=Littorina saxatilis TaxID=31220 RepID=UPI0038B4C7FF
MDSQSTSPSNNNNTEEIPNDPGKMFIGGLSWQTSPETLRSYFEKYGEIKETMVMKDPATKRSRGFGFVTYKESSSVDKVLANGPHCIDAKTVDPKVAFPRKAQPKVRQTCRFTVSAVILSCSSLSIFSLSCLDNVRSVGEYVVMFVL